MAGNLTGKAFLAVLRQNSGNLLFRPGVHQIIGGQITVRIHPHVQGRIPVIAKSPFLLVQLGRRDPQIKQKSVRLINLKLVQNFCQAAEVAPDQTDPTTSPVQALLGCLQGIGILIDAD